MENERILDISKRFSIPAMDNRENLNDYEEKIKAFQIELTKLINNHSLENITNTPDFIISNYLINCLRSYHTLHFNRDIWYCKDEKPVKKCIMCDKLLSEQERIYDTSHYLCSFECVNDYMKIVLWRNNKFIVNEKLLNEYRKKNNQKNISITQIEKRIDNITPLKDVEK